MVLWARAGAIVAGWLRLAGRVGVSSLLFLALTGREPGRRFANVLFWLLVLLLGAVLAFKWL